jgi:hypothetical protein
MFLVFLYIIGTVVGILAGFYLWPPGLNDRVSIKRLGSALGIIAGAFVSWLVPFVIYTRANR